MTVGAPFNTNTTPFSLAKFRAISIHARTGAGIESPDSRSGRPDAFCQSTLGYQLYFDILAFLQGGDDGERLFHVVNGHCRDRGY